MKDIPFYVLPFYKLPAWLIIVAGVFTVFLTSILFVFLLGTINGTTGSSFALSTFKRNSPLLTLILAYVIIGPLIETLLQQYLVMKFLPKISLSIGWCLIISALLFSLSHWQSIFYAAYTLPHGFIYGIIYLIFLYRNDQSPFVMTALTHILFNGLLLFIQRL